MKVVNTDPGYLIRIIQEEKKILTECYRHRAALIREAKRLKAEGADTQTINEGFLDALDYVGGVSGVGGALLQTFKYDIAGWLIGKLGVDPQGWFGRAITNILEEADITDWKHYFSPAGCHDLADVVVNGLVETGVEPLVDGAMGGMGLDPRGRLYATVRETLTNSLLQGEIAEDIKVSIADWVCGVDVTDVLDQFGDTLSDFSAGDILGDIRTRASEFDLEDITGLFGSQTPAEAE